MGVDVPKLILNYTTEELNQALQNFNSGEWIVKPDTYSGQTEITPSDTDIELPTKDLILDKNIIVKKVKVQDKTDVARPGSPAVVTRDENGYLNEVTVTAEIPSSYVNTSDANAGVYDIYNGKTAYVNGQKITGKYQLLTLQLRPGSTSGCTTSQLQFSCPFEPLAIVASYTSDSFAAQMIISMWAIGNSMQYYALGDKAALSTTYQAKRFQFTHTTPTQAKDLWWWSNGTVYIKKPPAEGDYEPLWRSGINYRVFAIK